MRAASTRIALGTLCCQPLLETGNHFIFYFCSLPLGLHIFLSGVLLQFSPHCWISFLLRPIILTAVTLQLCLVLEWFRRWGGGGELTSCVDLLWAPIHAFCPTLISALVLCVSHCFTLSHKLCLLVVSLSSPPHAY